MRDQKEFDTITGTTGILSRTFVKILCLGRHISRSGIRKIWLATGVSLARSGIISSCDMITCISRTPSGVVISFGTGEMIAILRCAYFSKRSHAYAKWICAGEVSDRDYM